MLTIFDCDGMLVDSEIIAARVDAEHLTQVGYAITPEEVAHRFAGLTAERMFAIAAEELGRPVPPEALGVCMMEWRRCGYNSRPLDP